MKFTIKESGKNGTIEAAANGLTRTEKRYILRSKVTFINYNRIDYVKLSRKHMFTNVAEICVGGKVHEWKCRNAVELIDTINHFVSTTQRAA